MHTVPPPQLQTASLVNAEREEVQEGKAHLFNSTTLMAFLKANRVYLNPLSGSNAGEYVHCLHCVPWNVFLR